MITMTIVCPYCNKKAAPVTGKDIYPHRPDLWEKKFFRCLPCGAHVGTHVRTGVPLGTLANSNLRRKRSTAHAVFDPLWREGSLSRTEAYRMLAKGMNITFDVCHIGNFDEEQCQQVIDLCNSKEIHTHGSQTSATSRDKTGDQE